MEMRTPTFQGNPGIAVERTKQEDAEEWCKAYLQAFYGNLELFNPTLEIIRRSMKQEGVTFVSARIEKSIVGTLVMYKKQDVFGVYCVGTVSRFRKKGVANTMMEFANDVSRDARATMILQTMLSDKVEDLYIKLGLVPVYRKEVFAQQDDHRHHLHS
jgi:predicted GNAT family acetyltransferase